MPNAHAVRLASRHNDMLGMLLRDSRNPAYSALLSSVQLEAQRRQFEVVTVTVSADDQGHNQLAGLRRLLGFRVAGLMVATGDISGEQLRPFLGEIPVLRTGRPEPDSEVDAISYDEPAHARLLTEHLVSLGHRDIAVLRTDARVSYPEWVRGQVMIDDLVTRGLRPRIFEVSAATDGVEAAVDLAERAEITALMCPTDARQLTALRAAHARRVAVPEALSISGCDGLMPGVDLLGLTTVRLPVEELAKAAVARIVDSIAAPVEPNQHSIAGTLIEGTTTAARSLD
ncbi:MAG: LacI family transcriptional regulator [Propionibacteriales bacterium]|nr:LacI family transcriptional regulator [Propionibacteriales bacterium]